jgi:hypothetical protein
MNLFGKNKKDAGESSSSPVVSEKTKDSVSFLKKTANKIGSLFSSKKKSEELTTEPMSNTGYLGEIYKLMVKNRDDAKLERQEQVNRKEEEDSEDQKRHEQIIKALTIRRRPKPKRVVRREKKAEEKAKKAETKPAEKKPEAKPAEKKPETKPAEKPVEKKPETKPAEKKPAEKKPEAKPPEKKPEQPTKQPEKKPEPKKETAEKQPPAEKKPSAEPVKQAPKPGKRTAEMIKQAGVGVVAAISAVGVTNVYAQKAILQTSAKESQIDLKSDESGAKEYLNTMNKRGYGYIQQTFPQLKPGGSLAKKLGYEKDGVPETVVRQALEKGNETWYDMAYNYPGNKLGNKESGDGWKYRGRGLVAITGRANYEGVSKVLNQMGVKVDLVKDPDKLQDPDIAYKAAVAYYILTLEKGNVKKGLERLNSYKNQDEALREIIRATAGMGHKVEGFEVGYKGNKFNEKGEAVGEHLFVNYERAKKQSGLADDIIKMSQENQDMKKQNQTPVQTVNQQVNNTTNTKDSTQTKPVDDRPAWQRK